MTMQETSTKPYLIRALHDWCTDNGYSPHIIVEVDENTVVPMPHVQDGKITLNISYLATNQLLIGNEYIEFQARFNGSTEDVFVPVAAVAAIFARETGAGMGFEVSPSTPYPGTEQSQQSTNQPATTQPTHTSQSTTKDNQANANKKQDKDDKDRAPHLRIIK